MGVTKVVCNGTALASSLIPCEEIPAEACSQDPNRVGEAVDALGLQARAAIETHLSQESLVEMTGMTLMWRNGGEPQQAYIEHAKRK